MNDELYDVVQVGYGPVGQTMAALLGRQGHSVAVFERWPDLYALSRAGHCDHEIMRILQSVGGAAEVEAKAWPMTGYEWFNAEGEVLLRLDWDRDGPSGWHSDYLFYQPDLEEVLDRIVRTQPTVEVSRGWEAVSFVQHDGYVELTVRECGTGQSGPRQPSGTTRTVRARYVIGADGANSFVRRASGIGWEDLGFEAEWLVVDVRPHDPGMQIDMPDAGQICDPARPTSLFRWLGRRHCRWEFMLLPGEIREEMESPEASWRMLARWGLTPDNADLVRNRVYRFRSLLAEEWRTSRAILVGDAAHLMPPFMGQGMCSGLRDAKNLAWKLDLVLRGKADPALLDTYEPERKPHVRTVIEMSVELGKVICVSDPEMAAARDEAFFSGRVPPPPPFPGLVGGALHRDAYGTPVPPAGRLGVQGRVTYRGRTGLFDDVVGQGWAVIGARSDHRRAGRLSRRDRRAGRAGDDGRRAWRRNRRGRAVRGLVRGDRPGSGHRPPGLPRLRGR